MKKLLYFLIGFTLPFIAFSIAYSESLPTSATCGSNTFYKITYYPTTQEASDARDAYATAGGFTVYTTDKGATPCDGPGDFAYAVWETRSPYYGQAFVYLEGYDGPPDPSSLDSDGDGLPDNQDMYPNDPTPYFIKLVSYWTDDGSASGNHIYEVWITDRGDYLTFGEKPADDTGGFYTYNDATWLDPADGSQNVSGPGTPSDEDSGSPLEQPTVTTGVPDGDAPADSDTTLQSGTKSTGTETDNEALKGIMDNTGDIATNTKRQGEYMRSLNAAIQNMNRNQVIQTDLALDEATERKNQHTQAEAAKNTFDSTSVSDHYNSENFSGELTEGTDYEPAAELEDQSWFTGFFTNNPLKTAYDNSGFTMSNSTCQMTLTISGMGTHNLSLCEFDQEFTAAGNLLLALTSLTALIIIAWR